MPNGPDGLRRSFRPGGARSEIVRLGTLTMMPLNSWYQLCVQLVQLISP